MKLNYFFVIALSLSAISCSQKKFEGGSALKAKQAPAAAVGDQTNTDSNPAAQPVVTTGANTQSPVQSSSGSNVATGANGVTFGADISNGDKEAIKKCLNLWGTHPFKVVDAKASPASYKKMSSAVSVAGIQINGVNDSTATNNDVLVLIDPSVNIASTTEYKLMNPKGWYCMKFQVAAGVEQTRAVTNVKLHCTAKLAKSTLVIGVDSASNTGVVGVNSGNTNATVGIGSANTPGSVAQGNVVIDGTVSLKRVDKNFAEVCAP